MSDFTSYLVPTDWRFIPTDEAAKTAELLIHEFWRDDNADSYYSVESKKYAQPRFITSGEYFEKFTCPNCGKEIDGFSDMHGGNWWSCYFQGIKTPEQILEMPCCGSSHVAGDIYFGDDASFARFALILLDDETGWPSSRQNVPLSEELREYWLRHGCYTEEQQADAYFTGEQMKKLAAALGCPLRRIIFVM